MEELNQVVVFKLGSESYGVSITKVKEIIEMMEMHAIPSVPAYIEGMLNVRGDIHVIFNLRKKFGMGDRQIDENAKIVLVNGKKIGFIVDDVCEIIHLEQKDIENTTGIFGVHGKDFIDGIAKVNGDIIIILNLGKILNTQDDLQVKEVNENRQKIIA